MSQIKQSSNWIMKPIFDNEEGGLLIPISNQGKHDLSQMLMLSPVAAWIWEQLDAPTTKDSLIQKLLNEFEVDAKNAATDLDECLSSLHEIGAIDLG